MNYSWGWRPYVSVAERREQARHKMAVLKKKGVDVQPVEIEGRKIARTFWGESWCDHLESFSDYANRLPRGRTYVRNGSVCHLHIARGEIKAIVSGSELYDVKVTIKELPDKKWAAVKERSSGQIGSLLELLKGRFSTSVMKVVTDRKDGLFPLPAEIDLDCSCPDWADMCKHVAAVLYGVGARLDEKPELLFLLRGVAHEELLETDSASLSLSAGKQGGQRRIAEGDLAGVFGIDLVGERSSGAASPKKKETTAASRAKSTQSIAANARPPKIGAAKDAPATAKYVRELRSELGLTQESFGLLVGVATSTVSNWEKKRGRLNLQPRTLKSLNAAAKLTKKQALRKLDMS